MKGRKNILGLEGLADAGAGYDKYAKSDVRCLESNRGSEYNSVKAYFKDLKKITRLEKEEETLFFERARQGDRKARERIISSNLGLVVYMAEKIKKSYGKGTDLLDLIQLGNIGLIKAVEKYDSDKINPKTNRPYKFSTYAGWWITQVISRGIPRQIKLPAYRIEDIMRYNKTVDEMEQEQGHKPPASEISEEMGIPVEEVRDIDRSISLTITESLDAKFYAEDSRQGVSLGDIIRDEHAVAPSQGIDCDIEYRRKYVLNTLDNIEEKGKISSRDKEVYIQRYGLDNGLKLIALRKLGDLYNLTGERTRQIIQKVQREFDKRRKKDRIFG